ncbi:glucokinase [Aquicoccus sp.]|uniref:glucokinase n=1 Tax=Aquicoccus sp. TaxID=2055851 RepID=UPI00356A4C96
MTTLLADIGGTKSRLALARNGRLDGTTICSLDNDQSSGLIPMLADYAAAQPVRPRCLILAAAGPVRDGHVRLTNRPDWSCSASALSAATGIGQITLLNDLQAMGHALAVPEIAGDRLLDTRLVLAIGTGLNVALAYPLSGHVFVPPGESGYQSLPFTSESDAPILAALARDFGSNSAEALVSGPGLTRAHRLMTGADRSPDDIITSHPDTRDLVLRTLGAMLGSLALMHLPYGGIYLAGSVGRALHAQLDSPHFRHHFAARGAYSDIMGHFVLRCIDDDLAPLHGLAHLSRKT